jgi:serine/threonine-protein kinase
VALMISLIVGVAGYVQVAALDGLERFVYDLGVRGSDRTPDDQIAVIGIDDESIANLGRFPWPRDVHAEMIDLLSKGGARVISPLVFFSEDELDPGLQYIEALIETYRTSGADVPALARQLGDARAALDTDAVLASSLGAAGNVVLPMTFEFGEPRGNPDAPLPAYLLRNVLANVTDPSGLDLLPPPVVKPSTPPIARIGEQAAAIGHMSAWPDSDGGTRREPLVVRYYDQFFPSMSLQIAARSLNLTREEIAIELGEAVRLGRLIIRTSQDLRMNTFFYADRDVRPAFQVDSFYDVITGDISPDKYKDKIVLIGAAATGLGDRQKTPVSASMAPVVVMAHTVSSILGEDFFVTPPWGWIAELAAFVLVAAYLIAVFPRLSAGTAAGVSLAILVVLLGTHYALMTTQATWLKLVLPMSLVVLGHVLLTTKRFLMTERGKLRSEAESAETSRMLGLAYQGKGDLDMAFASFRKVNPVDDALLDLLYNLALDFERKRQFNKAGSVYQFVAEHNPKFRDIETRMNRSKALEDTVLLGSGSGHPGATLLLDGGGVQKPMLGRYEVDKELGKGAMGVVYLGRDPKINRVVAIKTMALSQEFEADEIDEVKERFFREAETAGRLNHPHIVTIFDAGEEHDLAYIAMEFLKGEDLAKFTKPENLLPVSSIMDIVSKAADALDYAHGENVVHRDIKPANIMYEVESNGVKLTDFGIARITDSSKTKTGMVLGTPSYMSPEQLAGKKVDGRSDLFSLGVMLYQLLTGQLPFQGDSMATLMFKIANEPHPDPTTLRSDLPPCLKSIIDRALAKSPNDRYSRGAQLVGDLKACASQLAA